MDDWHVVKKIQRLRLTVPLPWANAFFCIAAAAHRFPAMSLFVHLRSQNRIHTSLLFSQINIFAWINLAIFLKSGNFFYLVTTKHLGTSLIVEERNWRRLYLWWIDYLWWRHRWMLGGLFGNEPEVSSFSEVSKLSVNRETTTWFSYCF
jgi:hypothetical protein